MHLQTIITHVPFFAGGPWSGTQPQLPLRHSWGVAPQQRLQGRPCDDLQLPGSGRPDPVLEQPAAVGDAPPDARCGQATDPQHLAEASAAPAAPPAEVSASASRRDVQFAATAQQCSAALLAGDMAAEDALPPQDGLAAGKPPPPPPPGMFAFASGRGMQVSAAAAQRAAVLLATDAASDADLDTARSDGMRARSPGAGESGGHMSPPPPPGMFAFASGRSMQVSAAAQERAAALLADAGNDAGPDAVAMGSPGRSGGEAGPASPPPGIFAFASGRGMQVSAAAQDRAAALLLADAGDDAGPDAAAVGSPGRSSDEAGPAPPPPGILAFASGRGMQVSAAAQERAAALLLADAGDDAGPDAAAVGSPGRSGDEAGPAPPPPGIFAFASGRGMQVPAAAQERAAALLADAGDATIPDAAHAGSPSRSGGEAGPAPLPPGVFAFASGRSMQVSAAAQQRAAALLAADAGNDAAPASAGAGSPGAGEGGAQTVARPAGVFAFASGRGMRVSAASQQRAIALLALDAEASGGDSAAPVSLGPCPYPGIEMPSLADDGAMLQMLREASGGSGTGAEQPAVTASPDANPGSKVPSLGTKSPLLLRKAPGGSGVSPAGPAPAASPDLNPDIDMPSLGDDGGALQLLYKGEERYAAAAAPGLGPRLGSTGAAAAAPLPEAAEALPPPAGVGGDVAQVSRRCCGAGAAQPAREPLPAAAPGGTATEPGSPGGRAAGETDRLSERAATMTPAGVPPFLMSPAAAGASQVADVPAAGRASRNEGPPARRSEANTGACADVLAQASHARAAGQTGSDDAPVAPSQPDSSRGAPQPPVALVRGSGGLWTAEAGPPESVPPTVAFADNGAEEAGASSPRPNHAERSSGAAAVRVVSPGPLEKAAARPKCAEQPGEQSEQCEAKAAAAAPSLLPTVLQGDAAAQSDNAELHVMAAGGFPPTLPLGEAEPENPDPGLPPTLPLAGMPGSPGCKAAGTAQASAEACPALALASLSAQAAHAAGRAAKGGVGVPEAAKAPAAACGADDMSSLRRSGSASMELISATRADPAELSGSKRSHSEGRRTGRASKRARRASCGAQGSSSSAGASSFPDPVGPAGANGLPRRALAGADAGVSAPAAADPVPVAAAAAHAAGRAGGPEPDPKPWDGAGAWATAGGERIRVDAAKAAAARALLDASRVSALGGPAQQDAPAADPDASRASGRHDHDQTAQAGIPAADPGAMGSSTEGAGVWAMATGKRVHVDPAKLTAAEARLGKRAPLAERGAPGGATTPDPKRRAAEAGVGGAVGVRVRGDTPTPNPDCMATEADAGGVLGMHASSVPARMRRPPGNAGAGPDGGGAPAVEAGASTPAARKGGRATGGGRALHAGSGSESGSRLGQGTPAGSGRRRAPGSLSRSAGGSCFKAPRRFVSPVRNPRLARVR